MKKEDIIKIIDEVFSKVRCKHEVTKVGEVSYEYEGVVVNANDVYKMIKRLKKRIEKY